MNNDEHEVEQDDEADRPVSLGYLEQIRLAVLEERRVRNLQWALDVVAGRR